MRSARPAAGVLALLAVLAPLPVHAAEGDPDVGWWSRSKVGPPAPAPEAPDAVPDGGGQVAGDPTGPVSVTALRIPAVPGTRVSGLRLPVARSTGTVAVRVCPAAVRWAPVDGDRLDAAPAADCGAAQAEAVVEGDRLVVSLPAAFGERGLDVVLAPVPGSAFVLDLAPPAAEAVLTATTQAPAAPAGPAPAPEPPPEQGSGSGAPPAVQDPPAAAPDLPGLAPGTGFGPDTGAVQEGPVVPPLLAAEVPVPQGPPADLPGAAPQVAAPPVPPVLLPALAAARPDLGAVDGRREQVAAFALLAGLLALAVGLQRQPVRAVRHLGGGARLRRDGAAPPAPVVVPAGRARGVGRWRSPRSRPPVPTSS